MNKRTIHLFLGLLLLTFTSFNYAQAENQDWACNEIKRNCITACELSDYHSDNPGKEEQNCKNQCESNYDTCIQNSKNSDD